jgi:hypothetical protein
LAKRFNRLVFNRRSIMSFDANDTAKDLLLAALLDVLDGVAAEGGEEFAMKARHAAPATRQA